MKSLAIINVILQLDASQHKKPRKYCDDVATQRVRNLKILQ